jgi:hypothetical protein
MPTNTFERKIEIKSPKYAKKLIEMMTEEKTVLPPSKHSYSDTEREKNIEMFRNCLERSKKKVP